MFPGIMSTHTHGRSLPFLLLLAACTASAPTIPSGVTDRPDTLAWTKVEAEEEACSEDDQCVTLLCSDEACGIYRCEDVPPQPETLAYRGGVMAPPGSGPRRNWGRPQGGSGNGLPVFIIPWRFHDRREQLPSELARLQIRDSIKHHLFPQQPSLAAWFRVKGINIHQHTMIVERAVHDRIHRGAEGGPWNAAWRDFANANRGATEAEIWEHAVKLIFRFELTGPIVPFHWRVRPETAPK